MPDVPYSLSFSLLARQCLPRPCVCLQPPYWPPPVVEEEKEEEDKEES